MCSPALAKSILWGHGKDVFSLQPLQVAKFISTKADTDMLPLSSILKIRVHKLSSPTSITRSCRSEQIVSENTRWSILLALDVQPFAHADPSPFAP